jgi:membrane protein implicated in regulation of membrane protease activity
MFKRIAGVLLVIIAVLSLVFSLAATYGVWRVRKPVAEAALAGLQLADSTLTTTNEALMAVDDALLEAAGSVAAAQDTFQSLSQTIYATGPLLEGLAGFLGEGLPDTLRSTQSTVTAAAESARIVDTVLETLAAIPFVNFSYAPQTPLSETLGNVADTLRTLPDGLEALGADLSGTGGTLPDLARSLDEFGASISTVDESLASAQEIIASYQALIDDYQAMIATLERLVPALVSLIPAALTFAIFWLAVVQIAALLVGWRWARGRQSNDNMAATFPEAVG